MGGALDVLAELALLDGRASTARKYSEEIVERNRAAGRRYNSAGAIHILLLGSLCSKAISTALVNSVPRLRTLSMLRRYSRLTDSAAP
jgi:hypothetical protein